MIQYSDPDPSIVPWNTNTFPLPFSIFEDPANGNDDTGNDEGPCNWNIEEPLRMSHGKHVVSDNVMETVMLVMCNIFN